MTIANPGLIVVVSSVVFLWLRRRSRFAHPYPPSPPGGLPLLGNALQLPIKHEWETYERWGKELGTDIMYLNAAGTQLVILNSLDDTKYLLETRSAKYSSRYVGYRANRMGFNWIMPVLPYTDAKWKAQRRMFSQYFHASDKGAYEQQVTQVIRRMAVRFVDAPENFMRHARLMVGGVGFSLAYGIEADRENDPNIILAEKALGIAFDASLPGKRYLVDLIPAMKYIPEWFPGANFQKDAKEGRRLMNEFLNTPFAQAEQAALRGTILPSLVSRAMDDIRDGIYPDPDLAYQTMKETAATFYAAASATTTTSVNNFILSMMMHPDIQKKAQKELDSVVGSGRLPQFSDAPQLPYIFAVLKESMRWRPTSGLGLPHMCVEDDIYKGYLIPKGALVMANQWLMQQNPVKYPEPHKFIPERFLTADGKPNTDAPDPYEVSFGFGRRVCPGSHIATAINFMAAATLLSLFEISKPLDEHGKEIEPSMEVTTGVTAQPLPFKCSFTLRSKYAEDLIRSSVE
ncbi:cytochrome P450 [Coprinopsis marcescibilis]|uniref:Cytochrome P450 n=1 Tax=Coprinopsis marcescibilis TaxID=230819 RepID=A0A5C3KNC3_COPMA|nr:cytochrome P450 [Coprinopsis marcescibilis]